MTAIDVLLIINYINTHPSGEGETVQPQWDDELESAVPSGILPNAKRKACDAFFAELADE